MRDDALFGRVRVLGLAALVSTLDPSSLTLLSQVSDLEIIDPVDLATRMMEIDSTSGREGPMIDWMDGFLTGRDWTVQRIPVTDGRDDVLATIDGEDGKKPRVILSTHLDTVPPFIAPRIEGGTLRGRGACDAKGIAAAMSCAAERLRERRLPVGLLFVVGEEVTHDGAHAANAFAREYFTGGRDSRILINGEPTDSTLAVGTKGAMRVFIRVAGEAAHSAYPHLGRSATRDLVHLLAELDDLDWPRDELLGETTVNIGHLAGGVADNVMAPAAEARLMIRLVTAPDEAWRVVERWAAERASIERGPTVPPVRLGVFPGFETSVAAFATDIPELSNWGRPHLFGPGSVHVAHRDDEHVRITELRDAVQAYEQLALAALA